MSEDPTLNIDALPDWAKRSLAATTTSRQPVLSALSYRGDPAIWPLLLDAAVVGSFLPKDLAPQAPGSQRADAERAVLRFAHSVHSPGGLKWTLKPEWRREILGATILTPELDLAVLRTATAFSDPVSTGIRLCVKPPSAIDLSKMDLENIEGLRVAVASVEGIQGLTRTLPSLDQLDGELEMRRLLAQFRRMVGRKPEAGDDSKMDLFVGRSAELTRMRNFVGAAAAETILGNVKRWVSRSRSVLPVWGIGGVGKTTLIARFMLEHAEIAATRSPFAYLDFDRSTVSAQDPLGLLVEMCLQTGAQFQELLEPMSALAQKTRAAPVSLLQPLAREFRQHVDRLLDKRESLLESARPFLLVFDTFEVVQYSETAVPELEKFIRNFSFEKERNIIWPRLRLIVSGRQRVATFLEPISELDALCVGALDVESSTDLLAALARDASKPIRRDDAKTLVVSIAKLTTHPELGLEPLRLHLLGQIFSKDKGDGPAIMDKLIIEFSKPLESNGLAAEMLIDGILVRRVLGHVQDARVRALADPGLVVRRITAEVIQKVMVRAASDPAWKPPQSGEEQPPEWNVSDTEAKSIYEEFRKQVDLVVPDAFGLQHRPDVREQMLPLIRARDRDTFFRLQRLAFHYFSAQADCDPQDVSSAAEAVYHGLWLEEDLTRLNQYWRRLGSHDPKINPQEFAENSSARIFLRAKAGAVLDNFDLPKLPADVRIDWFDARSKDLLKERRLSNSIISMRIAAGQDFKDLNSSPETASVAMLLLYRAGLWSEAVDIAARLLDSADPRDLTQLDDVEQALSDQPPTTRASAHLAMARTWATIAGKTGGSREALLRLGNLAESMQHSIARLEIAAHTFAGLLQAGGSVRQMDRLVEIVDQCAALIPDEYWLRASKVLRLTALILRDSSPRLLRLWAQSTDPLPRELCAPSYFEILSRLFEGRRRAELESLSKHGAGPLKQLDEIWWLEKSTVIDAMTHNSSVRSSVLKLAIYDHSDWVRPLGNALAQTLLLSTGGALNDHLSKQGFQASERFNGIAIADAAVENGRFLELARELAEWRGGRPELRRSLESPYPQDVFEVAQALLRWHSTLSDEFAGETKSAPPKPPDVTNADDPQKTRWGSTADRGGRRLSVRRREMGEETFTFDAIVESTDSTPLEPPVVFHLHDSYPRSVIRITKIREGRRALLEEIESSGDYTIGVQVKSARDTWLGLELELGPALDLPKRFLER